jgi:hypothetical protein
MFGNPQPDPALASGDAGCGVQQPVAQLLRLGFREVTIQQQCFGPGDQVDRGRGEFQPRGVDREDAGGEAAEAGVLAGSDAVLDPGVGSVAGVQPGDRAGANG